MFGNAVEEPCLEIFRILVAGKPTDFPIRTGEALLLVFAGGSLCFTEVWEGRLALSHLRLLGGERRPGSWERPTKVCPTLEVLGLLLTDIIAGLFSHSQALQATSGRRPEQSLGGSCSAGPGLMTAGNGRADPRRLVSSTLPGPAGPSATVSPSPDAILDCWTFHLFYTAGQRAGLDLLRLRPR